MSDLKPCPFCGNEDLRIDHMVGTIIHPAHEVVCDHCGARSGFTDKDCVEDWNTRATVDKSEAWDAATAIPPKVQEEITRLRAALVKIASLTAYETVRKGDQYWLLKFMKLADEALKQGADNDKG